MASIEQSAFDRFLLSLRWVEAGGVGADLGGGFAVGAGVERDLLLGSRRELGDVTDSGRSGGSAQGFSGLFLDGALVA